MLYKPAHDWLLLQLYREKILPIFKTQSILIWRLYQIHKAECNQIIEEM